MFTDPTATTWSVDAGVAALLALDPDDLAGALAATDSVAADWADIGHLFDGPDHAHFDALVKFNVAVADAVKADLAGASA